MNQAWDFKEVKLGGVRLIRPFIAVDTRGSFFKDYSKEVFEHNGIFHELKEVFTTVSQKGVIRGIHFQRKHGMGKLVRCMSGHIFDVVVDLRKESPTFGQWQGFDLIESNELYIPGCYGHGFLALEPSIVSYKCDEKFYGEYDDGIIWNDLDIAIDWPLEGVGGVILSDKDKNLQTLAQFKEGYGGL